MRKRPPVGAMLLFTFWCCIDTVLCTYHMVISHSRFFCFADNLFLSSLVIHTQTHTDPPALLFDAIPEGPSRRIAGLLLWIHVAVSYAINSQAICASLDRQYLQTKWPNQPQRRRWMVLTLAMAVSSYMVANAIPFFQDLVSLI